VLDGEARRRADVAVADGLVERRAESLMLTDRGRLLADAVVRDLLAD
jgi:oxygen-independent coproporphyrinogen-3 oxidase